MKEDPLTQRIKQESIPRVAVATLPVAAVASPLATLAMLVVVVEVRARACALTLCAFSCRARRDGSTYARSTAQSDWMYHDPSSLLRHE